MGSWLVLGYCCNLSVLGAYNVVMSDKESIRYLLGWFGEYRVFVIRYRSVISGKWKYRVYEDGIFIFNCVSWFGEEERDSWMVKDIIERYML